MSPLPTTDLSGYGKLKSRVIGALSMLQESRSVDFKKAVFWNEIKIGLTKDILAMSNLRDGGILIIGVEESDSNWTCTGISDTCFESYDSDSMHDFVNKYASPPVSFDVVKHAGENDLNYLVVQVHEFTKQPVVCKRNYDREIREGAFYIRPLGKPETREVQAAHEMQDLLDLAVEKRIKKFLSQMSKIGIGINTTSQGKADLEIYDKELGDEL